MISSARNSAMKMDNTAGRNIAKGMNRVSLETNFIGENDNNTHRSRNEVILNSRRSNEKATQRFNTVSSPRLNTETGVHDGARDTNLQTYLKEES